VTADQSPAPPAELATPLKLLIADEPNGLRRRIIEALGQLAPGLELVVVDNGAEAVRALADLTPDLAIIGTGIEQTYCFEVCDFMRADERLRKARIIFASELNPRAWDCKDPKSLYGADAWLSNAASNDELLRSLRGHLEAVRPGPPAA
jgi:PleD family two-component response regulator